LSRGSFGTRMGRLGALLRRLLRALRGRAGARRGHRDPAARADDRRRLGEQTLRESEARLSSVIGSAMDAIITTDEDRRIIVFNRAAEDLFGVPSDQALGGSLDRFIPERYRGTHAEHMRRFGETGATTRSMHGGRGPLPALRADGTEFPVEATISQATVAGRLLYTVVLRDVTARVEAERERTRVLELAEEARRSAEEANRAKSEFLAAMSHELRTPLNAIAGYTELLELGIHGPTTAEQLAALDRIKRNQRHLLVLISDILQFARIEAGQAELRMGPVPVAEMLEGLEPLIEPQMQVAGIAYTCRPCDPALHVTGDRERIEQILLNLLTNAIKFTAAGGAVELECQAHEDIVALRVRDTGQGIPSEMLERIFEAFVQVDRKQGDSAKGIGLGLAISRDLARAMNGDLTVESTLAAGSTFTLSLPR
jgi:PAS domain S-box-containing protein